MPQPTPEQRRLAQAGLERQRQGQKPTAQQQRALEQIRRLQLEEHGREYLAALPKGEFCEYFGRPTRVVAEWALAYRLPWPQGKTCDVRAILRWMGDLISQNGHRLRKAETPDELLAGTETDELKRLRRLTADKVELELAKAYAWVLPTQEVQAAHLVIAEELRRLGETVQRQYGPEALELVTDCLDTCRRRIDQLFEEHQFEPISEPENGEEKPARAKKSGKTRGKTAKKSSKKKRL